MRFNKKKLFLGVTASSMALMLSGAANAMSWEIGDSTMNLFGYAKLDVLYDVDADLGNAISRSSIRLDGEKGSEGHLNLHAYQSRFGMRTSTPTDKGDFITHIEIDFWGSPGKESSSQMLRLRRAYAQWNGILAGQTSSNFGPETAYMPTLDFYGQPGGPNGRVPQIRYTTGNFSVSIEDPEIAGGSPAIAAADADPDDDTKSDLPTFTAAYSVRADNLVYVVSGSVRKLDYYDISIDSEDSVVAWGALVQAAYTMGGTTIRGGVTHGIGIGKQIYFNSGVPAYYDAANQSLEAVTATAVKASISQQVGPGSVNFGFSQVVNDVDDEATAAAAAPTMDETQSSFYLNYIWSPLQRITYGIEVSHHTRETFDGREGDASRLHASLQYKF